MVKKIIFFLLLYIGFVYSFELSEEKIKTATSLIGQIVNCNYEYVEKKCDSLIASEKSEPLYPLIKLCSKGLMDLDFDYSVDSAGFMRSYNYFFEILNNYRNLNGEDSYYLTMKGFAYAAYASFFLLHKKYFAAVDKGMSALDLLDKAKELDTSNYDADFFLGFYQYASGELKKRLWMVLFWYPGNTKRGLKRLESCAKYGKFASSAAKMVIADVYIREKKYNKALKLIDSLLSVYPESRFVLWSKARYYEALKNYENCALTYKKLADDYMKEKYGKYNELITRELQLKYLSKAGRNEEIRKIVKNYEVFDTKGDKRLAELKRKLLSYKK